MDDAPTLRHEAELTQGLQSVLEQVPLHTGYVQVEGIADADGLTGRVETGAHLAPNLSAFAYGQVDKEGASAGLGARWTFSL